LKFHKPSYGDLSEKEWLVTNGLGGYASSTISGANTRRYHGLLVASMRPPTERTVVVSKVEETIIDKDSNRINLSSNQYPGVVHPNGYQWITRFEIKPFPVTTFKGENFKLTKTISMVHDSNTTIIQYQNVGKENIHLELNTFYVYRDYHHLFQQNERFNFLLEEKKDQLLILQAFKDARPVYIRCPESHFQASKIWYKNFMYAKETERGLDDHEDACSIGIHTLSLTPGQKKYIIFTIDENQSGHSPDKLFKHEKSRLAKLARDNEAPDSMQLSKKDAHFYQDLTVSGHQFIVKRSTNEGHSIIAGYHWFTDWGRDTMIAMRGLVIAGHHHHLAKDIIKTFLQYMKDGLIPNRFPDHGETPEYNTIDASLWLFIVLYEFYRKFEDKDFVVECLPSLKTILSAYRDGTKFGIHMTEESLIYGGEGLSQLTWMDAKVGDYVVTPRHGCPVEINALWYNALCIYNEFQQLNKSKDDDWALLAGKVKKSFRTHFLNKEGYLNDVVVPDKYADNAFRSNQVYALSLPFSILTKTEGKKLLDQIGEKLVTPYGLRTLSMDHPDFAPIYIGDQWHRDKAYHQGTVWAFLLGEYLLAFLRMNKYSPKSKKQVLEMMSGLRDHFYHSDCINGISEIFDGADPGPGRGCIHQAWSVGMLLLVFHELKSRETG
jgi:predicted glycogen debranching enzyme